MRFAADIAPEQQFHVAMSYDYAFYIYALLMYANAVVPNLFVTAGRSTIDNFAAALGVLYDGCYVSTAEIKLLV